MSEPTYRQTLVHSWKMVWHNKSLWGLGLLSALFAGGFGINNFLGQLIASMSSHGQVVIFSLPNLSYLPLDLSKSLFSMTLTGIVMIAVLLGVIFVSVMAKTALLIAMADYYKTAKFPSLNKIWNASLPYFARIFTLEMGRKIAYFILLFIFGLIWVNVDALKQTGWGMFLSSLLLVIIIIIALMVSSVTIFASGYTVIDDRGLKQSVRDGYKLFKKHFLVCLELSLLLLFIDFLLVAVVFALASVLFLPAAAVSMAAVFVSSPALAVFGVLFSLLLTVAAVMLVGAIYNAFYIGAWMYLFMEMHHNSILSRVRNFFKRMFR